MKDAVTASVIQPGRWCPPSYGLGPSAFAAAPKVHADVVYGAGGLYGNRSALARLIEPFDLEPAPRTQLIFKREFHRARLAGASAAHQSYWNRMVFGPGHLPEQAARGRFRRVIG